MINIVEHPIMVKNITLDEINNKIRLSKYSGKVVRFVAEYASENIVHGQVSVINNLIDTPAYSSCNSFRPRSNKINTDNFNVVLIIPTGLGASVGGYAGDGGSVAKLMGSVCDTLITHPNVVNASDINEMTENTMYVEGYTLSKYLLGQIGLQKVLQNRVLVIIDGSAEDVYINAAINSVNAARATYGFNCSEIVVLESPFIMETSYSEIGRANGKITNLDSLFDVIRDRKGTYDAIALTSLIKISKSTRDNYYKNGGVNPWGGVEAMLTHAISHCFAVPCAHSPMMESVEVDNIDFGVVDPRDAAEITSVTYLQCILKGLQRAPDICNPNSDISCIVIPKRCLGIPILAAKERNIPVIAVDIPLAVGNFDCTDYVDAISVNNYLEAIGAVSALRSGISVESLRRPLEKSKVTRYGNVKILDG